MAVEIKKRTFLDNYEYEGEKLHFEGCWTKGCWIEDSLARLKELDDSSYSVLFEISSHTVH